MSQSTGGDAWLREATRVSFRTSLLEQWSHINFNPHLLVAMVTWCTCLEVSFVSSDPFAFFYIFNHWGFYFASNFLNVAVASYPPISLFLQFLNMLPRSNLKLNIIVAYMCSHIPAVPVSQQVSLLPACQPSCSHLPPHTPPRQTIIRKWIHC